MTNTQAGGDDPLVGSKDLEDAYRKGYTAGHAAARAEPWQDLRRRFLAGVNAGSVVGWTLFAALLVGVLISLFQ